MTEIRCPFCKMRAEVVVQERDFTPKVDPESCAFCEAEFVFVDYVPVNGKIIEELDRDGLYPVAIKFLHKYSIED